MLSQMDWTVPAAIVNILWFMILLVTALRVLVEWTRFRSR